MSMIGCKHYGRFLYHSQTDIVFTSIKLLCNSFASLSTSDESDVGGRLLWSSMFSVASEDIVWPSSVLTCFMCDV